MNRHMILIFLGLIMVFWMDGCAALPGPSVAGQSCLQSDDCASTQRCQSGLCVVKDGLPPEGSLSDATTDEGPERKSEPDPNADIKTDDLTPDTLVTDAQPEAIVEVIPEPDCQDGDFRACYTGSLATRNTGTCQDGKEYCKSGVWGACEDDVTPTAEICDGFDNNCNGTIDEGCPCNVEGKQVGVCTQGQIDSSGVCTPPATYNATKDTCGDGLDNNCNGAVDEGCQCMSSDTRVCGSDVGECKKGVQECVDSKWVMECKGEKTPAQEKCDDKDHDCNGFKDNGCPCIYLGKDNGVCKGAVRDAKGICQAPMGYRFSERCGDGLDNNCDGYIDDRCPCHYMGKNAGVCKTANNDDKGKCQRPTDYNSNELCGDGKDNNCDGFIDEGCPCNYLGKNAGVCKTATKDSKGICQEPAGYNVEEVCGDNLDNNCNGFTEAFSAAEKCLAIAKKCTATGVSPGGLRDVCIWARPFCNRSTKVCPNGTNLGQCVDVRDTYPCITDADCAPCITSENMGPFACYKKVCIRISPLPSPLP